MQPGMLPNQLTFPSSTPGPSGSGAGAGSVAPAQGTNNVVWRGNLRVQWDSNEVVIPAIAHSLRNPCFSPLVDASTWPSDLICNTGQLTEIHHYFALMTEARAQWLARIIPVDENNGGNAALQRLVRVMTTRSRAIEIECTATAFLAPAGTLYLWSTDKLGMIAVYRPTPPPEPPAFNMFGATLPGMPPGVAPGLGVAASAFGIPRACGTGIWSGFLQVRLHERAENLYVSACQSNVSRDFGVLDTSTWPYNLWCSLSNMSTASPLLESMHENSNQWIVRFVAASPSNTQTANALRALAVYMQARRLLFEISCGTLNGDELMLCLFGVVHTSYGNSIVGGFRIAPAPQPPFSK